MNWKTMKKNEKVLLVLILLIGFGARLFMLGRFPDGINQDEAYAGYEAYSLLHYGMDSSGYHNPMYLTVWGSGMSALYSYLTIPFLLLNGGRLSLLAVRLPQALFGCLTLVAVFFLLRRFYDNTKMCLLGLFVLAVAPWHIMISRWGLDANLAPAFLVFGLFFWVKGMENSGFLPAAAVCYGLSLYCYAPLWVVVPLILLLQFLYCVYTKRCRFDRYFVIALCLLAVLTLPVFLFMLINNGYLPEIKTPFLSIPKLWEYRGGELSLSNLKVSILKLYRIFMNQQDATIYNSAGEFGLYYKFSTVFAVIGIYGFLRDTAGYLKRREYNPRAFVLMQAAAAAVFALLIGNANVNKLNFLFIPLILCSIQGIAELAGLLNKTVLACAACAYAVCFLGFYPYFLTEYNELWGTQYLPGAGQAVETAQAKTDGKIYSVSMIYPVLLFYSEMPVTEYLDTMEYYEGYHSPRYFGRFVCSVDYENPDEEGAYIITASDENAQAALTEQGFTLEAHGAYLVGWKE